MASVTILDQVLTKLLTGEINFLSDDIRVILCSSLTIDSSTDVYLADVTKTECTGSGYTTGGKLLINKTISYSTGSSSTIINANELIWTYISTTANYALIYDSTATNSPLIGYIDFGAMTVLSNDQLTLDWVENGIFNISESI
jgi:hypothetical protein